jgi:hypothetical protein
MRRTEKGRAYGVVTAKALSVLERLLWGFHNAKSGHCYPGYERIAEAAGCARSTVAEALKALEDAGLLTWVQRVKRVRESCPDLIGDDGWRWRVCAHRTVTPSPILHHPPSGRILLSSKIRLEHQTKFLFPFLYGLRTASLTPSRCRFRASQPESSLAMDHKPPPDRKSQRPTARNRTSADEDARSAREHSIKGAAARRHSFIKEDE